MTLTKDEFDQVWAGTAKAEDFAKPEKPVDMTPGIGKRPLNEGYDSYRWSDDEGELTIWSQCCDANSFSAAEELVLRDYLNAKYPA